MPIRAEKNFLLWWCCDPPVLTLSPTKHEPSRTSGSRTWKTFGKLHSFPLFSVGFSLNSPVGIQSEACRNLAIPFNLVSTTSKHQPSTKVVEKKLEDVGTTVVSCPFGGLASFPPNRYMTASQLQTVYYLCPAHVFFEVPQRTPTSISQNIPKPPNERNSFIRSWLRVWWLMYVLGVCWKFLGAFLSFCLEDQEKTSIYRLI